MPVRRLGVAHQRFFGPWDEHNFVFHTLRALAAGEKCQAPVNAAVSPTYVPDLANAALDLLIDGERGIWHVANQGEVSWGELADSSAERSRSNPERVQLEGVEQARTSTALDSSRGRLHADAQFGARPFLYGMRAELGRRRPLDHFIDTASRLRKRPSRDRALGRQRQRQLQRPAPRPSNGLYKAEVIHRERAAAEATKAARLKLMGDDGCNRWCGPLF